MKKNFLCLIALMLFAATRVFDGIIYNDAPLMRSTDNVVFGFAW